MHPFPRLDVLPASQKSLWMELTQVPPEFTLYGGTAIALHLGHRQSIDFDFFGTRTIEPDGIYAEIPFLQDSKIIQKEKNTLSCLVDRGGPVKISFFGLPHIRSVKPPHIAEDNRLRVASLLDLAGMKAAVVQSRAETKDYIDLDAIISSGIDLPLALSAAQKIYGPGFNPQITLKAMSYFDDGDLQQLSDPIKSRIIRAVAETDLNRLPNISSGESHT